MLGIFLTILNPDHFLGLCLTLRDKGQAGLVLGFHKLCLSAEMQMHHMPPSCLPSVFPGWNLVDMEEQCKLDNLSLSCL